MVTANHPAVTPVLRNRELEDDFVLTIPRDAHTLAGFRRWVLSDSFPEKQPVMFLNGEIFLYMPKENLFTHSAVKTAVAGAMFNLNLETDFGELFINGVLVTNVEADLSGNPDMVGILWESLESGRVRYVSNENESAVEIEGSPDWLLEIVSDSSVKKDKRDLRQAYHKAGVREYWIIDARGKEIEFQILYWRKSGYVAAPRKNGWQRSRMFGRSFQLTRSRDRRGGWRYLLEKKAD
jgi:Uma2 family endonuclease